MDINDFLSNPGKEGYKISPGVSVLESVRALARIETYIVASVKNQRRILQKLTTGEINEEEIEKYLDILDERSQKEYLETMARIIEAGER